MPAQAEAPPDVRLQPHRAVYDMTLGAVASSASIASVSGRMVFEFTGSTCEGYTVNSRFVTQIDDEDGRRRVTDLRSSTYESPQAERLQFLNQTYVNRALQDEVKGVAERADGRLKIELSEPEEAELTVETAALFPTAHMIALIEAAEAGENFFQADLFDGSDDGRTVYATTAVIGERGQGIGEALLDNPAALDALGEERAHWPVTLSYFDLGAERGEQTPNYELSFLLYDDGISRDLTLDYGEFTLEATLTELEMLEAESCE